MNKILVALSALILSLQCSHSFAQVDSTTGKIHRVAIFVPLYLDSAFDGGNNYRYDKNFPKFLNPGLEFYEGAQLALDSLQLEGAHLDVQVYDTRSATKSIAQVLQAPDFQPELIIGHVTPAELKQLADAATHKNIPFININYPNNAGVTNNPYLVILNSTLKTHCEGIYKYLQRNYATSQVTIFRKKGALEDMLKNYFMDIEKNTASVPLKLKYVTLNEPIDQKQFLPYLDSTRQNICLGGSLDETFARIMCLQLADLNKTYPITVVGMPTWDNITDFSQPEYTGLPILYTTPFYMDSSNNLVKSIQLYYKTRFFSRPSDMVFRGYETIYHFAKLLQQYGTNLAGSISDRKYEILNAFDIQPVFLNKQNMTLDYFENKKLYFIRKLDGNMTVER